MMILTFLFVVLTVILWTLGILIGFFFCLWVLAYIYDRSSISITTKHYPAKVLAPIVCYLSGIDVVVHGKEHLLNTKGKEGYVIIGNHQSMFDILIMGAVIKDPMAFIAKKETRKVPFIGIWAKTIGCQFIDRGNLRQSYNIVMNEGAKSVSKGLAMMIFPSGTRSMSKHVDDFKAGSFKMATSVEAPILPVTLVNAYQAKEASFFKRVKIHVYIHEAIYPKQYQQQSTFLLAQTTKETIETPFIHHQDLPYSLTE